MIEQNKSNIDYTNKDEENKELIKIYSTPQSTVRNLPQKITTIKEETKELNFNQKCEELKPRSSRSIIIEESDQNSDENDKNQKFCSLPKIEIRKNQLLYLPEINQKHSSQNLQFSFTKRLGYKSKIRKSISADIDKIHDYKKESEAPLPKHIMSIIDSIDIERKLQSRHNSNRPQEDYPSERMRITDFRREGVQKERRLSRIDLGKQLALSETSGLKLQWMVNFKNIFTGKDD